VATSYIEEVNVSINKTITYQSPAHTYGAKGGWTNLHIAILAYDPTIQRHTLAGTGTPPVEPTGYDAGDLSNATFTAFTAALAAFTAANNMYRDVMTEDLGLGIKGTAIVSYPRVAEVACEYCIYFKELLGSGGAAYKRRFIQAAPGQVLDPTEFNTRTDAQCVVVYEDVDLDGDIDAQDRKRSFDDAFDDGSPPPDPGASSAVLTAPADTPVFPPAPVDPLPVTPSLGEEVAVTAESLILLMNPLVASVIADNMQTCHFHRMDERASKIAAIWNALTGNQNSDGSVRIPLSQTIVDGLAVAQHAIEFAAIAVRRDLAGDDYHDQTGLRLWTQPRHEALYSYPSLGSNTEVIVHLATIVNLKAALKQQVDDATLITSSYEAKLQYLQGVKTQFDGHVQLAGEMYDNTPTAVRQDYLNAYLQYSSSLLVATNYHIGTIETWRPTAMPDIITIPLGFDGPAYTRSLERMVHYKLRIAPCQLPVFSQLTRK